MMNQLVEINPYKIVVSGMVSYDSGTGIELLPGFVVGLGVTFDAYIDGCED